jgi:hypothetical protein
MAHRTLSLTVHNPNKGVYPHPPLVLVAGKSGSSLTTVSTSPLPSMGPGETTTVQVNVVFPAFSFGNNEVIGTLGSAALKQSIKVTTTIVPWGLIALGLVILQLILVAIRNAVRRRNARRRPTTPSDAPGAGGEPPERDTDQASRNREAQPVSAA